jgi:anti-anti-sigma factor
VKQLPPASSREQKRIFLRELEGCLNVARPCVVLDCSQARQMDKPALLLLLCCLEEVMKRNGDVVIAAVQPEARASLKLSGIERLFRIFDTAADAVNSFQRPTGAAAWSDWSHSQPAESAA